MQVRPKRKAPRWKGAEATQKVPAESYTFSAPVRGWVLNEPLIGVQPGGARILDNWICTTKGARVRGGCVELVNITDPVVGLFGYKSTAERLFAATDAGIFEASAGGASAVTGLTSGDFSSVQFGTAGGDFLYAVNGADDAQLFDGATWRAIDDVSTPYAITGVPTSDLSQAWSFGSRVWFVEKNTLSAWYLGPGNVSGTATELSLASVFTKGGSLLFGAKWSLDAGDGLDDKCVFVTTEGEVAVYEGTDPGSASTWSRVGLYNMPKPMGKRAFTQAGGDLLIATEGGLIPISAVLKYDMGALEGQAVSRPIAPYWGDKTQRLIAKSWEMVKSSDIGCLVVSQPDPTGAEQNCLMSNLITGSWSRITGWDAQCLAQFEGRTYFGAADGGVYLMDAGGSDNGAIYTASFLGTFEAMGVYGVQKTIRQLRPIFETGSDFEALVSANADYDETLGTPASSAVQSADVWDTATWDTAVWDASAETRVSADWTAAGVTGSVIAPRLQIAFSGAARPSVNLVAIDAQFHIGAMVA